MRIAIQSDQHHEPYHLPHQGMWFIIFFIVIMMLLSKSAMSLGAL